MTNTLKLTACREVHVHVVPLPCAHTYCHNPNTHPSPGENSADPHKLDTQDEREVDQLLTLSS
jgi:hypothetical protein